MYSSSKEESQNLVSPMAMVSNGCCDNASAAKKRRKPPGNPDPDAVVVALSPKTLLATTRYICEVCHKGFQRDQNLQLHRRGHNLPWKLNQRSKDSVKKRVFVCPEPACAHHAPTRALGDLTGIKKHYSRKHGEKKWKCEKCSKRYAVQSDWKAHSKICGTKEYLCDCGTIFSRKDSFLTHRAFCSALKEEHYMADNGLAAMVGNLFSQSPTLLRQTMPGSALNTNNPLIKSPFQNHPMPANSDMLYNNNNLQVIGSSSQSVSRDSSFMSATALLRFSDESSTSIPRSRRSLPGTISYTNSTAPCMDTAARFVPFSDSGERKTDNLVHIREAGKKTVDVGNGKLTQDFLGLGASGTLSVSSSGNPSHYEEEMDPYHQTFYLATTLETYMWP